jgi:hypothetical protein
MFDEVSRAGGPGVDGAGNERSGVVLAAGGKSVTVRDLPLILAPPPSFPD